MKNQIEKYLNINQFIYSSQEGITKEIKINMPFSDLSENVDVYVQIRQSIQK